MKVRKKSQIQEKSVAKQLNARTVVASGSIWSSKGDVRGANLLVECKTTDKSFYSLTLDVWNKIDKEALKDGLRLPVMCVDLNKGKDRYAVFNSAHFCHYSLFNDTYRGEEVFTNKKSFRVSKPQTIIFRTNRKDLELSVVYWRDFLYMISID